MLAGPVDSSAGVHYGVSVPDARPIRMVLPSVGATMPVCAPVHRRRVELKVSRAYIAVEDRDLRRRVAGEFLGQFRKFTLPTWQQYVIGVEIHGVPPGILHVAGAEDQEL